MPTVLRIGPYRFHFYSDERGEPPHIHVAAGGNECKFWLTPVRLARNRGLRVSEVRIAARLVKKHRVYLLSCYHEFHAF
jgi:hypothetical protein